MIGVQLPLLSRPASTIARLTRANRERESRDRQIIDRAAHYVITTGRYRVTGERLAAACGTIRARLVFVFGSIDDLMRRVARDHADRVVDSIGLSPQAREALSDRDVRAIAMAVLGHRRLGPGE